MLACIHGSSGSRRVEVYEKMPANNLDILPPLVSGESMLATVDCYSRQYEWDLLYHGSFGQLKEITANIPYCTFDGERFPDSDFEVVCATPDPLIATFMALRPKNEWVAYDFTEEGKLRFFTQTQTVESFKDANGYVSVLLKDDSFVPLSRRLKVGKTGMTKRRAPEMRSPNHQIPEFNVRVAWADFEEMLAVRADAQLIVVQDRREFYR